MKKYAVDVMVDGVLRVVVEADNEIEACRLAEGQIEAMDYYGAGNTYVRAGTAEEVL